MKQELIEYAVELQADYPPFTIVEQSDSIAFHRTVPFGVNGTRKIGIAYKPDPFYDFAYNCQNVKQMIEHSLFEFNDQFFIDRGNGVPLVTDALTQGYNRETDKWETRRLNSIDWLTGV